MDTVFSSIRNCVNIITVKKRVRMFPNHKPWMNNEVKSLLKCHNSASRSEDRATYRTARADLKRGIRAAKAAYKRKV